MENKDRIAVLVTEYNMLRAERLAAQAYVIQGCSIGVPLFAVSIAFFLSQDRWQISSIGAGAAASAILGTLVVLLIVSDRKIRTFTRQLRALESRVNQIANERLLTWETDYGWGSLIWPINKQRLPQSQ